jgi:hypothetical protein
MQAESDLVAKSGNLMQNPQAQTEKQKTKRVEDHETKTSLKEKRNVWLNSTVLKLKITHDHDCQVGHTDGVRAAALGRKKRVLFFESPAYATCQAERRQ